ncbi:MAG: hypothetical protein H0U57_03425 [Tatlockia sp.]|nr:hypothetical protein [Tatlockia sp.]
MTTLNNFFSFLFINSKINTLKYFFSIYTNVLEPEVRSIITLADAAKAIYKKQIRCYFGLGFLLSFIPGTDAFLARDNLLSVIIKIELKVKGSKGVTIALGRPFAFVSPLFIFIRPFFAILFFNGVYNLSKILKGVNDHSWGLNRINPFLYFVQLIRFFIVALNLKSKIEKTTLPSWLHWLLSPLYIIGTAGFLIGFLLYFTTEIILNSLNTLLVEPLKFIYEVIFQFFETWNLEFTFIPTDDYLKIDKTLTSLSNNPTSLDEDNLYNSNESNITKVYETQELTLIECTRPIAASYMSTAIEK